VAQGVGRLQPHTSKIFSADLSQEQEFHKSEHLPIAVWFRRENCRIFECHTGIICCHKTQCVTPTSKVCWKHNNMVIKVTGQELTDTTVGHLSRPRPIRGNLDMNII
jgi:hypothetical protein